jgi:hypothetical protein
MEVGRTGYWKNVLNVNWVLTCEYTYMLALLPQLPVQAIVSVLEVALEQMHQ